MGGVVIGSTMELVSRGEEWLALTINGSCNLDCPICYLGKKESSQLMQEPVEKRISKLAEKFAGLAIIGTEALFDGASVGIVERFSAAHKTHVISNGVNLFRYAGQLKRVKRIDISLDGGPKTYSRSSSFAAIVDGAKKWKELSGGELYALNVICGENASNIDDMLAGGAMLGAESVYFSPFVKTLGGNSRATVLKTKVIVDALIGYSKENWKLMIDPYHALFEWQAWDLIKEELSRLPEENLLVIDFDPGDRVWRIDAGGRMSHTFMALHPAIDLPGKSIF